MYIALNHWTFIIYSYIIYSIIDIEDNNGIEMCSFCKIQDLKKILIHSRRLIGFCNSGINLESMKHTDNY